MQEDIDPDALSIQAPKRARWYTCLWPSCLGHGCCCRKRRSKFPLVNGQDTRSRLSEKPDGPASTPGKEDTTYVVTKSKKQLFYFTNICNLKKMKTEINLSSLEKGRLGSPGTAVPEGSQPRCWSCESKPEPLPQQKVVNPAESSFQTPESICFLCTCS
ncbi:uncharacterized protein LOC143270137 [Peromyscus maniculatus bairdii]|uniref:uncharacterized protein LOC143270137 n=1 Tax=Peromyscus maniculatus bairdii TaxID=230844 RepID=UPI003FCF2907